MADDSNQYWRATGGLAKAAVLVCVTACNAEVEGANDALESIAEVEQAVIPGATLVQGSTLGSLPPSQMATVTAMCPTGTVIVGGGYAVSRSETRVISSKPQTAVNRWQVVFQNFSATNGDFVRVFAECLRGTNATVRQVGSASMTLAPGASGCTSVSGCEITGEILIGGGFEGRSIAFQPYKSARESGTRWGACAKNHNTFQSISFEAISMCMDGVNGGMRLPKTPVKSIPPGGFLTIDTAPCPSGTLLHMGGLDPALHHRPRILSSYRVADTSTWRFWLYNDTNITHHVNGIGYCLDLWP